MFSPSASLSPSSSSEEDEKTKKELSVSFKINHKDLTFGRKLGEGGFGVVHQGTWKEYTEVAIKQLFSNNLSNEASEEFDTETQTMAKLRHKNIVQFIGYCVSPEYCIVMEYMQGGSLFNVLRSKQPLDWTIRARIAIDMASGLAFLHQENILHRDIKSLNVLLDENGRAKLTDFGLSRVKAETKSIATATKTNTNQDSVGTIQWMSPELFKRKAVYTQKSDVYSFGVTLWELASRKIPFADAANQVLIQGWVQDGDREDIPTDCPPKIASLIQACWDASPDKRPNAGSILTYLKSDRTDFTQLPSSPSQTTAPINSGYPGNFNSSASPPSAYPGNFNSNVQAPPLSNYQGNFESVVSNLNKIQLSPPPVPNRPKSPGAPVAPILNQFQNKRAQPTIKVDAEALTTFLKLVAEGEQDQAEKLLKSNQDLALAPGDVTDLAGRTFKGITAFQYAVWALDWNMWTMLKKHLPNNEVAREQIQNMANGSWVKQHGASASWQNLLDALQKTIDLCNASKWDEANIQWNTKVGGAQKLLPVHVINEYCRPDRPFEPCPDFTKESLPRTRNTNIGEWFTADKYGKLGEDFAYYRYSNKSAACNSAGAGVAWGGGTRACAPTSNHATLC